MNKKNGLFKSKSSGGEIKQFKLDTLIESSIKPLHEIDRVELAKKFNINLVKPQQSGRIKKLFDLYEKTLAKSSISTKLHIDIIENVKTLIEIYKKQKAEIRKLEATNEPNDFLKTRLAFVLNKDRAWISDLEKKIESSKEQLLTLKNSLANFIVSNEVQCQLLENNTREANENYEKALVINKELRNTIIGYENRDCLFKVGKLFLDYKIYVSQQLDVYRENLRKTNSENKYEYSEILRHFDLPLDRLADFQIFLQKKIESRLKDASVLKASFGEFYNFDVKQIEKMVLEIKMQKEKNYAELVEIINYYKSDLLKKQIKAQQKTELLVQYTQRRYLEKIDEIYEMLELYKGSEIYYENIPSKDDLEALLDISKKECVIRLDKLKEKYSNLIKPMTDDFDNVSYLIKRDNAFDPHKLKTKINELENIKILNVKNMVVDFEAEKLKLEELFKKRYDFINDPQNFMVKSFNDAIEKLRNDSQYIVHKIFEKHKQYWDLVVQEFNFEVRKFLTKFHYESAPWTHMWRKSEHSWMHDYLLINLSSEYLRHVGESLRNFSPEAQLYINVGKALAQFNEKSRELYKKRDEVEFEQLIRLNSMPIVDVNEIKKTSSQSLIDLKIEQESLEKVIKSFEKKFSQIR